MATGRRAATSIFVGAKDYRHLMTAMYFPTEEAFSAQVDRDGGPAMFNAMHTRFVGYVYNAVHVPLHVAGSNGARLYDTAFQHYSNMPPQQRADELRKVVGGGYGGWFVESLTQPPLCVECSVSDAQSAVLAIVFRIHSVTSN
jgi:hypothetical protein